MSPCVPILSPFFFKNQYTSQSSFDNLENVFIDLSRGGNKWDALKVVSSRYRRNSWGIDFRTIRRIRIRRNRRGGIETDSSIRYFLRRPVEPVGEYSVSGRALVSGMYRMWRKVGGGEEREVGGQWIVDPRHSPVNVRPVTRENVRSDRRKVQNVARRCRFSTSPPRPARFSRRGAFFHVSL